MNVLRFYKDSDQDVLSYTLDEAQGQFTGLPSEWFGVVDDTVYRMVILNDDVVVGFFVLDASMGRYHYTDNAQALLLRSTSINPKSQGLGLSKKVLLALPEFCWKHNSTQEYNQIVPGVNERNIFAQKAYEKAGSVKASRIFLGKIGVQYIYGLMA